MPITRVIIDPEDFFDLARFDPDDDNNYPNRTDEYLRRLIFGSDGSDSGRTTTTTSTTTTTTTIPNINLSVDWNDINNSITEYTLKFYQAGVLKHTFQYLNPQGTESNTTTIPAGSYDITLTVTTVDSTTNYRFHTAGIAPNKDFNFHQSTTQTFFDELIFTTCQFILDETGAYTTTTSTTTTSTTTSSTTTTTTLAPTTTTTSTTTTTTSTIAGITAHLSMTDILHDRPLVGYQLFNSSDIIQESASFGSNADGYYIISNFTLPYKLKITLLENSLIQAEGHYNIKIYKNFIISAENLILDDTVLLSNDGVVLSDLSELSDTRNISIVIDQIDDVVPTTTTTTTTTTSTTTTSTSSSTSTTTSTSSTTTTSTTLPTTTTTSTTTTTTSTIAGISLNLSMTNIINDRPLLSYQLFNTSDALQESASLDNSDGVHIISNFTLPFKLKLSLLDTSIVLAQGHYEVKIYKSFLVDVDNLLLEQTVLLPYTGSVLTDLSIASDTRNVTVVVNQIDDIAPTTTSTTTTTSSTTTTTSSSTTSTTTTVEPTTTTTTTSSTTTTTTLEPTTTTSTTTSTTTTSSTSSTTTTTTTIPGDFNFMTEIEGNSSDEVEVFINFEDIV